jgi:hypothetical protein
MKRKAAYNKPVAAMRVEVKTQKSVLRKNGSVYYVKY